MDFEALFPPLMSLNDGAQEEFDAVDIRIDDILLPPLEKAVDDGIYRALRRWNEGDLAVADKALLYPERIKKYHRIAALVLQNDSALDAVEDEQANVASQAEDEPLQGVDRATAVAKQKAAAAAARLEKKQRRQQAKERQATQKRFNAVVAELDDIDALRAERIPSKRIQSFVTTFKIKKRRLAQKRSMAATCTAMSFEFARREPSVEQEAQPRTETTVENHKTRRVWTDNDPILWFDVLHPSKDPARTQSFLVRRSQKLADLVDLIVCATDEKLMAQAKGSKLVYFGQQMFVDRRVVASVDYSEPIIQWIRAKPERQATFGAFKDTTATPLSLHTSTFADMELYVDEPGVYIHQGECEHLLRLRDARLPHDLDAPLSANLYPLRLPNPLSHTLRNCLICQNYSAKFVCYGDRLATVDPMFFCHRCYRAAHYDANGTLLYNDFLSFPYVQD